MTPPDDRATSGMTPILSTPIKATLVDITKCIGCHACQVACKQWNECEGEPTEYLDLLGLQNPASLSAKTWTLISFHEFEDESAPGGLRSAYAMRRCLHCLEPACVSACPTTALTRQLDGPVTYDQDPCIGCRYCMLACPWGVPTAEWDSPAPKIQKCTHCADRADQPIPLMRNGVALTADEQSQFKKNVVTPACVKACPADCLVYGERDELLAKAHDRIAKHPDKYVNHVYGEKEAGGTTVLYLSAVPFEKIGFPKLSEKPYTSISKIALKVVPFAVMAMGGLLAAAYARFKQRKLAVAAAGAVRSTHGEADVAAHDHPEFEPLSAKLWTPFNKLLAALMVFGVVSMVARFAFGLGGSTHLSDTYPWGLWIVFDLIWIAIAAGAFATAGLIYVFQRKDLYTLGRTAVLMGLLSYTFVAVTLVADLGLPWHFYQLAIQHPEHSAMFEVSWCVGMYVTILALEFLPVPLEKLGYHKLHDAWKRWSGAYVAAAMTLFVWMLSRNVVETGATAVIFASLAWIFRWKGGASEPILLAIAAVTLSTMHQSSLGSLYLLMQDQLAPSWWSPVLPVSFFVSSIVAGTALVILVEFWIAKGWRRPLNAAPVAAMGKVTFWSLLVYLALRLADLAVRGKVAGALSGRLGVLFGIELLLAIVPLILLASKAGRARPRTLFLGALGAVLGIILNRTNVVLLAMNLQGTLPQTGAEPYSPSIYEWGISAGLIAATIFLFGFGARRLPLLPKAAGGKAH